MKHYITVAAALLLSAVLIFNPAAKAASISPSVAGPVTFYAQLINQYTVDYEMDSTDTNYPYGNYNVYVYQGSFTVNSGSLSVDSYINGVATGVITCTPSTPSGYTLGSCNFVFNPVTSDYLYSGCWMGSSTSGNVRVVFDNFYTGNTTVVGVGTVTFTCSFYSTATPYNVPDPPVSVSVSVSNSSSSNCGATPDPSPNGLAAQIVTALNDSSLAFDDILQVLEDIRTQDQINYTTIIAYLSDNDTFNSTLYTWLTTILEDDFNALLDDTTYISAVLNAARNLISSMNSRDSTWYPIFDASIQLVANKLQALIDLQNAAASQANQVETAAAGVVGQMNAINSYSQPDVGMILTQADSYNQIGWQGQNILATILNENYFVSILLLVMTLGFVGYLLYGKGV